jgi:DNA-binding NarL/FixJ family response regulator
MKPKWAKRTNGNDRKRASNSSITPRLSERQKIILRGLLKGDNKTITRSFGFTEATVKVYNWLRAVPRTPAE